MPAAPSPYVLVAEPDATRRKRYVSLARDLGIRMVTSNDGLEAMRTVKVEGIPSAVLCELAMPRMDGFALLKTLRADAKTKHVPAVVVSSFRDLRDTATRDKEALGIVAMLAGSAPLGHVDAVLRKALGKAMPPVAPHVPPVMAPVARPAFIEIDLDETFEPPRPPGEELSAQELWRLERVAGLGLRDESAPDEALQQLVADTAKAFGVPVSLVSLVFEDRQWFKAHVGLSGKLKEERGTPRDWAFCRHVVEANEALVVPDAVDHPFFKTNPLVLDGTVRGYAGVPLAAPDGAVMGTLCVIDTKPLTLASEQLDALRMVGRRVAGELALRAARAAMEQEALQHSFDLQEANDRAGRMSSRVAMLESVLAQLDEGIVLFDHERRVAYANRTFSRLFGLERGRVMGLTRQGFAELLAPLMADPVDFRDRFRVPDEGPYAAREVFSMAPHGVRRMQWVARPVPFAPSVGQLALFRDVTPDLGDDRR